MWRYYLAGLALWLLLLAFFAWRLRRHIQRREHVDQDISYLVYLLTAGVVALLSRLVSHPPQWVSIAVLAVWAVASGVLSFCLNRRFNQWIDCLREDEKKRRGM